MERFESESSLDAYLNSVAKAAQNLRVDLEWQTTDGHLTDRASVIRGLDIFGASLSAIAGLRGIAPPGLRGFDYETTTTGAS